MCYDVIYTSTLCLPYNYYHFKAAQTGKHHTVKFKSSVTLFFFFSKSPEYLIKLQKCTLFMGKSAYTLQQARTVFQLSREPSLLTCGTSSTVCTSGTTLTHITSGTSRTWTSSVASLSFNKYYISKCMIVTKYFVYDSLISWLTYIIWGNFDNAARATQVSGVSV